MSTDREELIQLRISVARLAQALGVRGGHGVGPLRIGRFAPYEELHQLACSEERGWNLLVVEMIARVNEVQCGE